MLENERQRLLAMDVKTQQSEIDAMIAGQTFCSRLRDTVASHCDVPAQEWQEEGVWKSRTWLDLYDLVQAAALGLDAAGIRAGSFATILGGNIPDHVVSDLALLHLRVTPISLYETMSAEQIHYIMDHAGVELAIVQDEAAFRRIQSIRDSLPKLKTVIIWNGEVEGAVSWREILLAGRSAAPARFGELLEQVSPEDRIQIVYTSGTTGPPKAVILTHRMLLWALTSYRAVIDLQPGERLLSYLPMAHLAERYHTYYPGILAGCTSVFWTNFDTMIEGLRIARPAYLMGTPRVFEKLVEHFRPLIEDNPRIARAFEVGIERANAAQRGESPKDLDAFEAGCPLLRGLLATAGLENVRGAIVSGAPPGDDLYPFFHGLGFPLGCLYGQTEMGGGVTSTIRNYEWSTAGRPNPGVEVRLAEDGEILIRANSSTPGYYRDEIATANLLDCDGWLHSGDLGAFTDGSSLKIIGRKKEIIITAGGKNVSPGLIEGLIREHPMIDQACVIGEGRRYLTAVVNLGRGGVNEWAAAQGVAADAGVESAELTGLIAEHVAQINARLSRVEQIKRFLLVCEDWSVESGHFTPSLKLRRTVVEEQFDEVIEQVYEGVGGIVVPGTDRRSAGAA